MGKSELTPSSALLTWCAHLTFLPPSPLRTLVAEAGPLDRAHHCSLTAQEPDGYQEEHHDEAENHADIKQWTTKCALACTALIAPSTM